MAENGRPRRAVQGATGADWNAAGCGVASDNTTGRGHLPATPLVIERGVIRPATPAEMRRLARRGLQGVRA